jgi:hypothetical protein
VCSATPPSLTSSNQTHRNITCNIYFLFLFLFSPPTNLSLSFSLPITFPSRVIFFNPTLSTNFFILHSLQSSPLQLISTSFINLQMAQSFTYDDVSFPPILSLFIPSLPSSLPCLVAFLSPHWKLMGTRTNSCSSRNIYIQD